MSQGSRTIFKTRVLTEWVLGTFPTWVRVCSSHYFSIEQNKGIEQHQPRHRRVLGYHKGLYSSLFRTSILTQLRKFQSTRLSFIGAPSHSSSKLSLTLEFSQPFPMQTSYPAEHSGVVAFSLCELTRFYCRPTNLFRQNSTSSEIPPYWALGASLSVPLTIKPLNELIIRFHTLNKLLLYPKGHNPLLQCSAYQSMGGSTMLIMPLLLSTPGPESLSTCSIPSWGRIELCQPHLFHHRMGEDHSSSPSPPHPMGVIPAPWPFHFWSREPFPMLHPNLFDGHWPLGTKTGVNVYYFRNGLPYNQ